MSDIRTMILAGLAGAGAPAQMLKRPSALPSISFDINERPSFFGDGQEKETEYTVQVDVWSKGDYKTIATAVNSGMKAQGFRRYDSADLYDPDTDTYHKALRYRITLPA